MKIFGHPHIPSPAFTKISNIEEIDKVLANSIPWWPCESDEDFSLAKFCQEQQVAYAVKIHDLIQLLLYTNLDAKYLIAPKQKASEFQQILKEYLLDTQLLCLINNEDEIPPLALQNIDGAIFKHHLT